MSAVIQIVVALTVMMPPGSYRSLQLLTSAAVAAPSVVALSKAGEIRAESAPETELQPLHSQAPLRARSWTKVTFTVEQQCDSGTFVCLSPMSFWFASVTEAQPRLATAIGFPSRALLMHLSPRDALLALHKLLT